MIRTLDFNAFAAGTVIDDEYANLGVTVSAIGGSGQAMIFDSANPTGGDEDLASDTLEGILIVSEDGDSSDPDDNAEGGSIFFSFECPSRIKFLTFKDIEEGGDARMIFYDDQGRIIDNQWVGGTGNGGELTVQIAVQNVSRMEVLFNDSGAIDNLVFDDGKPGGENEPPEAADDTLEMFEDGTAVIFPLVNDSDPDGDPLTILSATSPNGSVTTDGTSVTFSPAPDYNGPAVVNYVVSDGRGGTDDADINITVLPVNDAPIAVDDVDSTTVGTPVVVDLRSNDTDVDDPTSSLTISDVTSPNGTISGVAGGFATFTPAAGFTGVAVINYRVTDPGGLSDTGVARVTVNDDPNTPPRAVDDVATIPEDQTVILLPLSNDVDPDGDPLTIIGASSPDGTVTFTDTTVTFTPAPNFTGPATVSYVISDGAGGTDGADITIDVTPVNDSPVAVDDTASTPEGTPVIVDLRSNDTDVDDPTPTLIISGATSPNGTVVNNGDGTVTFTPVDDFIGTATINYTVADPSGLTDTGVASVLVTEDDGGDPDGYVDGDDTGNLIDEAYDGDPNGDFIDNDDALLPGTEGDDDYVRAGGGDDTVIADDGSDTVEGGAGDDDIDTGNGDLAPDLGYPFAATDTLGYAPDSDPENDRDFVDGGTGDDTIRTGDDRDTIIGGDGEDVIDGGIDDDIIRGDDDADRIVGGEGNDSILGGEGNDTIYAGNDPDLGLDILDITDEVTPESPFSPDRQPLNGRDTVDGGSGDDVIFGADDDDLLSGGSGDDYIDGQIDDDTIDGNTGDDTLLGGQGDDSVEGGQGDDELYGGDGDDTLRGNRDDDLLVGGDGDDSLDGGGENDTVDGGEGDDSLTGNQGDDLLLGGAGADTMSGGAGRDTFNDVNAGDVIDGGSGPVDFDTLFLAGSAPEGGRFEITYTSADREDGFVDYFNADDTDAGRLTFVEIENVVPCFTPGTKIATPRGEVLVEDLKVGDRVITRDNGMQEIRWIGAREMTGAEFEAAPHLKPILIRAGALDNDLPERDMMVSPQHRVLIANDKTALYFEEREVLVAAKHLTDREGIDQVDVSGTTYIHIMFDQHEVILSDGAWTESFQPGDMSLAGIGDEQRQEILELFPELATEEGIESYSAARRSLKGFEAKLLSD